MNGHEERDGGTSVRIRSAGAGDAEILAEFNAEMARETEEKVLDGATVRAGVLRLIEDPSKGFYLLAEVDGSVAGSLMITTEWSDWRDGDFWWIQSVYVKPEARRRGVFRALYEHAEAMAREREDVCGMRLYVEKDNSRARRTYDALGMRETPYRLYEAEFE